jgi:hypothetical protein
MPNVVSAIDGTSHEIQIPSNEPQQKTLSANQFFSLIDMRRKFNQNNTFSFATTLGWLDIEFYDYTLSISLPMLNLKLSTVETLTPKHKQINK